MKLLTTAEAADFLRLSPHTLRLWRQQGEGPVFRRVGRSIRYAEADVTAFVEAAARTSTSDDGTGGNGA